MSARISWLGTLGLAPRHSGGAGMILSGGGLRLILPPGGARAYRNAEVDDYGPWRGGRPRHGPPLRVRLRARFSHPAGALRGTAGFGLWSYPNLLRPHLPQTLWFFCASPPSDMPLAAGVPGQGWKAAALDAGRPQALALLPVAPLAVRLMRHAAGYRALWPHIQRATGISEAPLATPMDAWHTYEIVWGERRSSFSVDGRVVLGDAPSPRGPMCLVAWVDNQYLVVTPRGRFGWGLLESAEAQWLEIADLTIGSP